MRKIKLGIFYLLSWTWGIIMSAIGACGIAALACMGKVHKYHGRLYGEVGHGWGGVSLGCFFFCSDDMGESGKGHECGHGLQNCLWGPLFPFVIGIPSMIRYWYRELKFYRKGLTPTTAYDDMWFEGQATRWGKKYIHTDLL